MNGGRGKLLLVLWLHPLQVFYFYVLFETKAESESGMPRRTSGPIRITKLTTAVVLACFPIPNLQQSKCQFRQRRGAWVILSGSDAHYFLQTNVWSIHKSWHDPTPRNFVSMRSVTRLQKGLQGFGSPFPASVKKSLPFCLSYTAYGIYKPYDLWPNGKNHSERKAWSFNDPLCFLTSLEVAQVQRSDYQLLELLWIRGTPQEKLKCQWDTYLHHMPSHSTQELWMNSLLWRLSLVLSTKKLYFQIFTIILF